MKRQTLFVQGLAIIYCAQQLMAGNYLIGTTIAILCVHLILYLTSKMIHQSWLVKALLVIDIIFLRSCIIRGDTFLFALVLLSVVELCFTKRKLVENIILVLLVGEVTFLGWKGILQCWLIYAVMIVSSVHSYINEAKMEQLLTERGDLLGRVSVLGRSLEEAKKEKKQTAYIAKVTERNELAQKLHDKMGHLLAGNVMQLEAIKLILVRDQIKGIELLERVISELRGGMDEIRLTLRALKPAASENGLSQIQEILEEFKEKSGIKSELIYKGDLERIGLDIWFVIGENLKETLTNLMKYSKGDQFKVSIEVMHQLIKISFKDNGVVHGPITYGLGLRGIEERILGIGGKVIINTDMGFETIMLIKR